MCQVFSCCECLLDALQRFVTESTSTPTFITLTLLCILCYVVCFGLFIAILAGVAYGYNYSRSEYSAIKKLNSSKAIDYQDFNDRISRFPRIWEQFKEAKSYTKILRNFSKQPDDRKLIFRFKMPSTEEEALTTVSMNLEHKLRSTSIQAITDSSTTTTTTTETFSTTIKASTTPTADVLTEVQGISLDPELEQLKVIGFVTDSYNSLTSINGSKMNPKSVSTMTTKVNKDNLVKRTPLWSWVEKNELITDTQTPYYSEDLDPDETKYYKPV